jgi:hypothetical protein
MGDNISDVEAFRAGIWDNDVGCLPVVQENPKYFLCCGYVNVANGKGHIEQWGETVLHSW